MGAEPLFETAHAVPQETAIPATDMDFADLPPIDPFDFSVLENDVSPVSYGFNTEELSGLAPDQYEPMMITANLEALADLLGMSAANVLDAHLLRQASLNTGGLSARQIPDVEQSAPEQPAGSSRSTTAAAAGWEGFVRRGGFGGVRWPRRPKRRVVRMAAWT